MKITILLAALFGFTAIATAADKKTEKPERKSRTEKKDEKKEVRNEFSVIIEGAKDDAAVADVKTWLSSIEGVRAEKVEKTDKGIEAVLSTPGKISRSDVGKAIKENKDLKVTEFKAIRPGRDKDDKKADEKKTDEKKTDDKKTDDKKMDDKKADETKPEDKKTTETKPDEKKTTETKPEEKK